MKKIIADLIVCLMSSVLMGFSNVAYADDTMINPEADIEVSEAVVEIGEAEGGKFRIVTEGGTEVFEGDDYPSLQFSEHFDDDDTDLYYYGEYGIYIKIIDTGFDDHNDILITVDDTFSVIM